MKFSLIALLLTGLMATTLGHTAQVYKWVDENGQTQFSQFPPSEKGKAEKIKVNSAHSASTSQSAEKLNNMRQKLLENSVDRNAAKEKSKEDVAEQERKAKNCELAKQQLRDLEANGRVYKTLENGEREWYDVEGRAKLINKAKKEISTHCSK